MKIAFHSNNKQNTSENQINNSAFRKRFLQTLQTKRSRQKPSWMLEAKVIFDFIRRRSTPQSHDNQRCFSQQKHKSCDPEPNRQNQGKDNLKQTIGSTTCYTARDAIKSKSEQREKSGQGLNKKILSELLEKREKFLKQFGYVKTKNNQQQQQRKQSISVVPCIEEANERLFLSEVEQMKLEKSLQQFEKTPRSVRRSKRQRENLNRNINEAEDRLQNVLQQKKHLDCFAATNKILSTMEFKPIIKQLNIERITQSLSKCSDRIYGKTHKAESVVWCTQILTAQLQEEHLHNTKGRKSKSSKNRELNKTKRLLEKLHGMQIKTIDDF